MISLICTYCLNPHFNQPQPVEGDWSHHSEWGHFILFESLAFPSTSHHLSPYLSLLFSIMTSTMQLMYLSYVILHDVLIIMHAPYFSKFGKFFASFSHLLSFLSNLDIHVIPPITQLLLLLKCIWKMLNALPFQCCYSIIMFLLHS